MHYGARRSCIFEVIFPSRYLNRVYSQMLLTTSYNQVYKDTPICRIYNNQKLI